MMRIFYLTLPILLSVFSVNAPVAMEEIIFTEHDSVDIKAKLLPSLEELKDSKEFFSFVASIAIEDMNPESKKESILPESNKDFINTSQKSIRTFFLFDPKNVHENWFNASKDPVLAYLSLQFFFDVINRHSDDIQYINVAKQAKLLWPIEQNFPFLSPYVDRILVILYASKWDLAKKIQDNNETAKIKRNILGSLKKRDCYGDACSKLYADYLLEELTMMGKPLPSGLIGSMGNVEKKLKIKNKTIESLKDTAREMSQTFIATKTNSEVQQSYLNELFEGIETSTHRQNIVVECIWRQKECNRLKKNLDVHTLNILKKLMEYLVGDKKEVEGQIEDAVEKKGWHVPAMTMTAGRFMLTFCEEAKDKERWLWSEGIIAGNDPIKKRVLAQMELEILVNGIVIEGKKRDSMIFGHDTMNLQEKEKEFVRLIEKIKEIDPNIAEIDTANFFVAWYSSVLNFYTHKSVSLQSKREKKYINFFEQVTLTEQEKNQYSDVFSKILHFALNGHEGAGRFLAQKFSESSSNQSRLGSIFGDRDMNSMRLTILFHIIQVHNLMITEQEKNEKSTNII